MDMEVLWCSCVCFLFIYILDFLSISNVKVYDVCISVGVISSSDDNSDSSSLVVSYNKASTVVVDLY